MSGLLLNERQVAAQPSLVRALGLTRAVVLQQVAWHFRYDRSAKTLADGHEWLPLPVAELADEIGLSEDAIGRTLVSLERDYATDEHPGLISSCQPDGRASRRKWYRINRDHPFLRTRDSADSEDGNVPGSEDGNVPHSHHGNVPGSSTSQQEKQERAHERALTDFEAWWSGYPRKTDKARAKKAYLARHRAGVSAERLLTARDAYLADARRRSTATEYLKHGATFLNGADGPWSEWEHGQPDGATRNGDARRPPGSTCDEAHGPDARTGKPHIIHLDD